MVPLQTLVQKWSAMLGIQGKSKLHMPPRRYLALALLVFLVSGMLVSFQLLNDFAIPAKYIPKAFQSSQAVDAGSFQYPIESVFIENSHSLSFKHVQVLESIPKIPVSIVDILNSVVKTTDPDSYVTTKLTPFIALSDLEEHLEDSKWINTHWFTSEAVSLYVPTQNAYLVVTRVSFVSDAKLAEFSASNDKKKAAEKAKTAWLEGKLSPLVLFFYGQLFSSDWREKKGYEVSGFKYPAILPVDFPLPEHIDLKVTYGPQQPQLLMFKTAELELEPVLIYAAATDRKNTNMYGAKLHPDDSDRNDVAKRALPFYSKQKEQNLHSIKFVVADKKDIHYSNWSPFIDIGARTEKKPYDTAVLFVTDFNTMHVIKCELKLGACRTMSQDERPHKLGKDKLYGGSQLIHMSELLLDVGPQAFIDTTIAQDVWVGFTNYEMNGCGCGQQITRPAITVVIKNAEGKFKMVQLSAALDFNLDIVGWNHLSSKSPKCAMFSKFNAKSIVKWDTVITDTAIEDRLTFAFSMSDSATYMLSINGLLKEVLRALTFLKETKFKGSDLLLALTRSRQYCKFYAQEQSTRRPQLDGSRVFHKVGTSLSTYSSGSTSGDIFDDEEEETEGSDYENEGEGDVNSKKRITLYPSYLESPSSHFDDAFPDDTEPAAFRKFVQLGLTDNDDSAFTDFKYVDHPLTTYNAFKDLEDTKDLKVCEAIREDINIQITAPINKDKALVDIVKQFLTKDKSLSEEQLHYFEEFRPFLKDKMEEMLKSDDYINTHWFRFAGTSAYLKEYGVYFMVSRVLFTPLGVRDRPAFSMSYAQIFNSKWEELENVDLIVPATDDSSKGFRKIRYPDFIHFPTYNNPNVGGIKWYGPEDPRLIIRKNHLGHEEPLVIFNQYQREIIDTEGAGDAEEQKVKFKYQRVLYMGFPWEFQVGKSHVDPVSFGAVKSLYNRATAMSLYDKEGKVIPRKGKEKNWTPFLLENDRESNNGVDKYLYFVYRWERIHILKCEIPSGPMHESICTFIYKNWPDDGTEPNGIGSLRGGSQLISVNDVVKQLPLPYNTLPQEYWLGIGRSKLSNCGCGKAMYRPQLLLLTKSNDEDKFQISHMSAFASFNLDIIPWKADKPQYLCGPWPNIILPNGIARWDARSVDNEVDDVLTLAYSNSDKTVELMNLRGILKEFIRINAFRRSPTLEEMTEEKGSTVKNDFYSLYSNLECTVQKSREFCKAYGKEHPEEPKEEKKD